MVKKYISFCEHLSIMALKYQRMYEIYEITQNW